MRSRGNKERIWIPILQGSGAGMAMFTFSKKRSVCGGCRILRHAKEDEVLGKSRICNTANVAICYDDSLLQSNVYQRCVESPKAMSSETFSTEISRRTLVASDKRLEDRLLDALRPFRVRSHVVSIGLALVISLIVAMVWAIAIMWADLIIDLTGTVRLWLSRLTLLVFVGCSVFVYLRVTGRNRFHDLSRRVDEYSHTYGLVEGALNLATKTFTESKLSSELAAMAIDQSVSTIKRASLAQVVSAKLLSRAACVLLVAIIGAIIFCLFTPRLAWTQANRFLFPMVDIPRYSLLTIRLDPQSVEVVFGEDCSLAAIAEGESIESMQLVVVREDKSEEAIPMLSEGEGRFSVSLSRLREPLTFYAKARSAKSKSGQLTIKTTPEIRSAMKTVRYPNYTGVAEKQSPLDQDGIKALIGSEVLIQATSNRPLKQGILTLTDKSGIKREVSLAPTSDSDEPLTVEATIALNSPGSFELRLEDVDGTLSHDIIAGPVEVIFDQPPSARIVQPRPDSLATPDAILPVIIVSEDDFGVLGLELYRSLNDSRPMAESLPVTSNVRNQNEVALPLSQYLLKPGDVIKLFARVEDNKPDSPQSFETPITTIKIISREEFQNRIVQQQGMDEILNRYRQIQRHLENAANAAREAQEAQDALEKNPSDSELQRQAEQKLRMAAEAANQAAEQISKIAEQPLEMELDQKLSEAMKEVAKQLAQNAVDLDFLAKEASQQNGELSEGQKEDLNRIASEMNASKKEVKENVNEPLERMKQTLPLMMAQKAFEELVQQQSDLAVRMESLREASDPNDQVAQRRIKNLESQQQALREQLNDLIDTIEVEAEKLPADPELESLRATATEFAQAVKGSEALSEMQNSQNELLANRPQSAAQSAAKAAEILMGFMQSSKNVGDQACKNCQQKFSPSRNDPQTVKDAMDQLMQMMGMKPGQSGMGSGFGIGSSGMAGIGGSERNSGVSNRGMYGALPMSRPSSGGRGENGGSTAPNDFLTIPGEKQLEKGNAIRRQGVTSDASNAIPSQYRNSVYRYFQKIADE